MIPTSGWIPRCGTPPPRLPLPLITVAGYGPGLLSLVAAPGCCPGLLSLSSVTVTVTGSGSETSP